MTSARCSREPTERARPGRSTPASYRAATTVLIIGRLSYIASTLRRGAPTPDPCHALRETVSAGPSPSDGISSIRYRASAVLCLLLEHPIDRRGRCRCCPGIGGLIGLRRRVCRILLTASDWLLLHPGAARLSQRATRLGAGRASQPGAASAPDRSSVTVSARCDPDDTDVVSTLPRDARCDPSQTPAVWPPLAPRRFPWADGPAPITASPGSAPRAPGYAVSHPPMPRLADRW
jgi:hypothetical protein